LLHHLIEKRRSPTPSNRAVSVTGQFAPLLLQVTLADFIRQGHFASHLKRMRRLYARRQERFVELCRQQLGPWMTVDANDSGIQLLGRFTRSLDDQAVAAAALAHGVDVQPVSINYHHDLPEHGLLQGLCRARRAPDRGGDRRAAGRLPQPRRCLAPALQVTGALRRIR
jgi:GntR family transcriptional regulator/MocR family aminotransferase